MKSGAGGVFLRLLFFRVSLFRKIAENGRSFAGGVLRCSLKIYRRRFEARFLMEIDPLMRRWPFY